MTDTLTTNPLNFDGGNVGLQGRLGADWERFETKGGKVLFKNRLAIDLGNDETLWVGLAVWPDYNNPTDISTGEELSGKSNKGDLVSISAGKAKSREYEGKIYYDLSPYALDVVQAKAQAAAAPAAAPAAAAPVVTGTYNADEEPF